MKLSDAIAEYVRLLQGGVFVDEAYMEKIKTIIDNHSAQVWRVVNNGSNDMAFADPLPPYFPNQPKQSLDAIGRWMREHDTNYPFPEPRS